MTLTDNERKRNKHQNPLSLTGLGIVLGISALSAGTPEAQSMTNLEACNPAYGLWVLNMSSGFLLFLCWSLQIKLVKLRQE